MKNKVNKVAFNKRPVVCIRDIAPYEDTETVKNKKDYPFILCDSVIVTVFTDDFKFSFKIPSKYNWNGADIPKPLWWIGSSKDNDFLRASLVHDFMLQYKNYMYEDILKKRISIAEYRRLTSLIFRQLLKNADINCIKANVMSFFVDFYQATLNKKAWDI